MYINCTSMRKVQSWQVIMMKFELFDYFAAILLFKTKIGEILVEIIFACQGWRSLFREFCEWRNTVDSHPWLVAKLGRNLSQWSLDKIIKWLNTYRHRQLLFFNQPRNEKKRTETHKFRKMHSNIGHIEL